MKKLSFLATGLVLISALTPVTAAAQTYYDEEGREIPRYRSPYSSPSYTPKPIAPSYTPVDSEVNLPQTGSDSSPSTKVVATAAPRATYLPAASDRCETDTSLSSYARNRVTLASNDLSQQMQSYTLDGVASSIKNEIDDTSLKTGGKMRDIYVGGASSEDKQNMVEEYLKKRLSGLPEYLEAQAQHQADDLLHTVERHLNQPAPMFANKRGSGSASRSLTSRSSSGRENTRSGSFKLQQRGMLGLHEDVGRFNYTITTRNKISIQNIHFRQQYDACPDPRRESRLEFGAKVTVTPIVEIKYSFRKLGRRSMTSHYRTFSGRFTIINQDRAVVRELDTYRPL